MKVTDLVIDLETMGTRLDAPIIAIGAVGVNRETCEVTDHTYYKQINLRSNVLAGAKIDPDTVLWWLKQNDAARAAFADNHEAISLSGALIEFGDWLRQFGDIEVWGNGATFDNVLTAEAFKRFGMAVPWSYRNDRCYRTLRAMFPQVEAPLGTGTAHNALDDAVYQAKHLALIFAHMKGAA
jgi:hypothetical protein